mmetsp:Transcript_23276/g.56845  ORF Transcript_23276/g.56845 Transcript_23276/m.56845 type:complete len:260 (+) Transcript_23276:63-842(+)
MDNRAKHEPRNLADILEPYKTTLNDLTAMYPHQLGVVKRLLGSESLPFRTSSNIAKFRLKTAFPSRANMRHVHAYFPRTLQGLQCAGAQPPQHSPLRLWLWHPVTSPRPPHLPSLQVLWMPILCCPLRYYRLRPVGSQPLSRRHAAHRQPRLGSLVASRPSGPPLCCRRGDEPVPQHNTGNSRRPPPSLLPAPGPPRLPRPCLDGLSQLRHEHSRPTSGADFTSPGTAAPGKHGVEPRKAPHCRRGACSDQDAAERAAD